MLQCQTPQVMKLFSSVLRGMDATVPVSTSGLALLNASSPFNWRWSGGSAGTGPLATLSADFSLSSREQPDSIPAQNTWHPIPAQNAAAVPLHVPSHNLTQCKEEGESRVYKGIWL